MNDEIKEILEELEDCKITKYLNYNLDNKDAIIILDYITNLQQELEEYKDTETYSKRFLYKANKDRLNANLELVKELEDYKSRIEKAVEYIELYTETTKVDNVRFPFELKELNLSTACRERLLNILQGKE